MVKEGAKQKARAEAAGIKPMEICVEADNLSMTTLCRFFNGHPKVQVSSARRIIEAIDRLEIRKSQDKAAG